MGSQKALLWFVHFAFSREAAGVCWLQAENEVEGVLEPRCQMETPLKQKDVRPLHIREGFFGLGLVFSSLWELRQVNKMH